MRRDRRRHEDEDEEEDPKAFWKGLARDILVAAIIVAIFLGAMYAYAGVWPPLVVVESSSMQHGDRTSFIGVIDTGDMVFQQAAPDRSSVTTYLEGRNTCPPTSSNCGYMTYGDYGDVIIFRRAGFATPVIHRAIMYITLHSNGTADVPDITALPTLEWAARNAGGITRDPIFLRSLRIQHMGFERNVNLTFNFASISPGVNRAGYVTMGDNNLFNQCSQLRNDCGSGYDTLSIARLQDVQGRARGEIPWLGLLKLTLSPSETCCARGWGDPEAPKNSWDSLVVVLLLLLALPFIIEYAGRGWAKYVTPRLPEIPWPWRRKQRPPKGRAEEMVEAEGEPDRDEFDDLEDPEEPPPREGSFEP